MNERENQLRLDRLAMEYLAALDAENFDAIARLWEQAEDDADLDAMLHGLNAEIVAQQDAAEASTLDAAVIGAIEQQMPSAEIILPAAGPVTVAEVAEQLLRRPPPGLTADDLRLNDSLRKQSAEIPADLGISQVVRWGSQFGAAPEAYWRAFRQAALKLRMQRQSDAEYRTAARSTRTRPAEGKP
jgi:hypothetical protein